MCTKKADRHHRSLPVWIPDSAMSLLATLWGWWWWWLFSPFFCSYLHRYKSFSGKKFSETSYIHLKIPKESKKMGPKKLGRQQVWEKWKNWQKMADFLGILLVIASKQTIFMNKIHRNNCCTRKKSQGIQKNGSQEAGETANVIKIERFFMIFASDRIKTSNFHEWNSWK